MTGPVEALFWISLLAVAYPYAIYPALLVGWNRLAGRRLPQPDADLPPDASRVILPVHNEARRIEAKIANLLALDYPRDRLQVIVIGDGCTDDTLERAAQGGGGAVAIHPLPARAGKAAALNAGLERATGEIVVFTDAGILLDRGALASLVGHFRAPEVGCVSGEDYVEGGGSEGLYGRLELLMRREEARLHSIAGASGCFYGMRRALCRPFRPGMAPDFLSVLDTVRSGHRALCEPAARGAMTATTSQRAEFSRKARTFLRGLTALFGNAALLNPAALSGLQLHPLVAQADAVARARVAGAVPRVGLRASRATLLCRHVLWPARVLRHGPGGAGLAGHGRPIHAGAPERVLPARERGGGAGPAACGSRACGRNSGSRRGGRRERLGGGIAADPRAAPARLAVGRRAGQDHPRDCDAHRSVADRLSRRCVRVRSRRAAPAGRCAARAWPAGARDRGSRRRRAGRWCARSST